MTSTVLRALSCAAVCLVFVCSCSDGGSGAASSTAPPPTQSPPPAPPPPPLPPAEPNGAFLTEASTARFLTQATFGPTQDDIDALTGRSASAWFRRELGKPPSDSLGFVRGIIDQDTSRSPGGERTFRSFSSAGMAFWRNAVAGDDQLRQRMAFALSQIFVVSTEQDDVGGRPEMVAAYQEVLAANAFGNYRDLLEEITYSPAMGFYLTYLQNQKSDPQTGRVPDENYAREIMQLFSIGLVELAADGSVKTDAGGEAIETYSNEDISGLARVFTGFSLEFGDFFFNFDNVPQGALATRMRIFPAFHSTLEKSFLGTTIPAGVAGDESVRRALDTIFQHPNVAPFISRQLIQRFVTSDPSPAYVARVAAAFEAGGYQLPDGERVGAGRRGDLAATLAAVLFDAEARGEAARTAADFGKVREPVIRFTNWARAFNAQSVRPEHKLQLWNTSRPNDLGQHPYRSPSVFNYYRPGYVAPGTLTGEADLTIPELQIVNANSISGYANFITFFIFEFGRESNDGEFISAADARRSFIPDYRDEMALASDPAALVDHLDVKLTYGTMSAETKALIVEVIENIEFSKPNSPDYDGARVRTHAAVLMAMTSPDYLVQR